MRSRDAKTFCCENQTQTHMVVGRVYGIKTPEGVLVYIGSSTMPNRIASHRSQCASLHGRQSCPLYRFANTSYPDGLVRFTEHTIATIELDESDPAAAKRTLRSLEALCIRTLWGRPASNCRTRTDRSEKAVPPTAARPGGSAILIICPPTARPGARESARRHWRSSRRRRRV